MKHKQIATSTLSNYEKAILAGTNNSDSKAFLATATKRTQAIVNSMLKSAHTEVVTLPDGTTVVPTIEEVLISKALAKELENPKGLETIEKIMKIRGEIDDKATAVSVSLVDKDLAERAVK